jgi:membrane protein insertase Oxa1/YidC/SpoIIIJ
MQLSRLLFPDLKDHQEKVQKLKQSGETQLMNIENEKWKRIQKEHGIKTNIFTIGLNLFQGLILICWTGLVQRFSFNVEDYPEMMTGGFLWFKDLSMTDPYFLLPIFNSLVLMVNTYVRKNEKLIFFNN